MLRVVSAAVRGIAARVTIENAALICKSSPFANGVQNRCFSLLSTQRWFNGNVEKRDTLASAILPRGSILSSVQDTSIVPSRNLTKFSLSKGKRKTVKTVIKRFYRLHWGIWLRRYSAHNKHMWKKSNGRKRRLRQHVFTNATQSWLLDTMVTKFWRRPRFYIDDPYNPYHQREEFMYTRRKPLP
ncbi:hypothetical protein KPH14_006108 [Odynerus spinipes]|uniref:Large ribosomal subunit protein bL35m n=1 Tax=Odynerus spinipes TaxID=1348599 RepID=A0AAD9RKC4_9HYME|nr:hypothetical protein KPH14_006108 [Odynerus spinipes]